MTPERLASFRGCGHEVGDEFVCQPVAQPEGMCPWAWADVESFVRIAAFEGRLDGATPPNSWVRCCYGRIPAGHVPHRAAGRRGRPEGVRRGPEPSKGV